MSMSRATITIGLCAGLLLVLGCGNGDEPPPRLNRVLGDGPAGAPLSSVAPDEGILANPATYTPTAGGPGGMASADAETAARDLMQRTVEAFYGFDALPIVEALDPNRAGPFADEDVKDALFATLTKLELLLDVWNERLAEPELAQMSELWNALKTRLTQQDVLNLLTYEVLDAEHVAVNVDQTRIEALLSDIGQIVAEHQGEGGEGGMSPLGMLPIGGLSGGDTEDETGTDEGLANAGYEEPPALIIANIGGQWLLQPPQMPGETDPAEVLASMEQTQAMLDKLIELIEEADAQTLSNPMALMMGAMMSMGDMGTGTDDEDDWDDEWGETDDASDTEGDEWDDEWDEEGGEDDEWDDEEEDDSNQP